MNGMNTKTEKMSVNMALILRQLLVFFAMKTGLKCMMQPTQIMKIDT